MRLHQVLSEAWFSSQHVMNVHGVDANVDVFKNPSRVEFGKLMREFEHLRGFFDADDVYVWRGDVLHHEIDAPGENRTQWDSRGNCVVQLNGETVPEMKKNSDYIRWIQSLPRLKSLLVGYKLWVEFR
jgi:hypothetical protein